jgi:hypothetical protein
VSRRTVKSVAGVLIAASAFAASAIPAGAEQRIPCEGAGGAVGAEASINTVRVFCADGSQETYRFAPI